MKTITAKFKFERSTKGTHKYQETDAKGNVLEDNYVIGGLYLRKSKVGDEPQPTVEVTVKLP